MKKMMAIGAVLLTLGMNSMPAAATTPEEAEKKVLEEFKALIPKEKTVSVDDLHKKWQEVQEKKSEALIIDIRTRDEFDTGHLLGSNNIDSGHAYTIPKKWKDPNTEMWVLCRTKHRATYFTGMLYRYGYTNVYLVDGGIVAWAEKGYPLVNEYLGEIKVVKYDKRLKEEYVEREGR